MDITGFGSLFEFAGKIIERFVPDPAAKLAATQKLAELQQSGELAKLGYETGLMQGQIDINKLEAASPKLFVAGWRPFVGWICASGLAVQFLIAPMATWVTALVHHPVTFPSLDMGTLVTLLGGLLGLSGMRTFEKLNSVQSHH